MCSKSLLSCFPIIKRARFFYLYDINGNRYLDLYLNEG
ncbi:Peptide methionine sulfoxide reductase [Borrelia duttonii CR2A]|uniref:Peptide methionine sulfoxide reductase n=2 Tax=Borrelia duttonii TaxID=40834 RepID=W6TZ57_9SPIR|nr:Peptide methionine sulfoxide reductase [Borrelia duttonii CR2A]